jgi:glutathione S-transferase
LQLAHEERTVDIPGGAQLDSEFLRLNPRGQVPVLIDGSTIWDAQAILVYLARRYDSAARWLPSDPAEQAQVTSWLTFAANELQNGVHSLRMHALLGTPIAVEQAHTTARNSLALLNAHLSDRPYLTLGRPTIADLACYPCTALAPEGKLPLSEYPHVRAWIARLRAQSFHVPMKSVEVEL